MGIVARGTKAGTGTTNFGASTTAKSSEVNTDFNTIYTLVNGNIDGDNISSSAELEVAKLDVSGSLTCDSLQLTGATVITAILDEDDMASDSASAIPTQQSVKAYVDANGGGATITDGTFTSGDLSGGVLTVTHNLGLSSPYMTSIVFVDNSRKICFPSDITCTADSLTADFLSYGTISGTYGWQIIS